MPFCESARFWRDIPPTPPRCWRLAGAFVVWLHSYCDQSKTTHSKKQRPANRQLVEKNKAGDYNALERVAVLSDGIADRV
jgi:hypothetical protein